MRRLRAGRGGAVLAALACALALAAGPIASANDVAPPDSASAAPMDRGQALSALESAEAPQRRLAVLRLAIVAFPEDAAALAEALRDEDEEVRELAEGALWTLWGRSGDPGVDTRLQRGTALMGEGQLDESIAVFSAIIAERPDFAEAWNKRATALFLKGDYPASMADCSEVERRNSRHFGMMAGMGQIWLRLGNLDKAEGWLTRALEVNPNMTGVAAMLEAVRAERHRHGRRDT